MKKLLTILFLTQFAYGQGLEPLLVYDSSYSYSSINGTVQDYSTPKYGVNFKPANTATGIPKLHFSNNDVIVSGLQFVAGFFDGWHEAINSYHWGSGKWFWDAKTSWKNKYKDYDNGVTYERYFFSKNLLVFTTDGYHLTRTLNRATNLVSLVIVRNDWKRGWRYLLRKAILLSAANRAGFYLSYNVIFK
jgi:hypothetical protein